jgi:hypothetical protein
VYYGKNGENRDERALIRDTAMIYPSKALLPIHAMHNEPCLLSLPASGGDIASCPCSNNPPQKTATM